MEPVGETAFAETVQELHQWQVRAEKAEVRCAALRDALTDSPAGHVTELLRTVAEYLHAGGGGSMEDRLRCAAECIDAALQSQPDRQEPT